VGGVRATILYFNKANTQVTYWPGISPNIVSIQPEGVIWLSKAMQKQMPANALVIRGAPTMGFSSLGQAVDICMGALSAICETGPVVAWTERAFIFETSFHEKSVYT